MLVANIHVEPIMIPRHDDDNVDDDCMDKIRGLWTGFRNFLVH